MFTRRMWFGVFGKGPSMRYIIKFVFILLRRIKLGLAFVVKNDNFKLRNCISYSPI